VSVIEQVKALVRLRSAVREYIFTAESVSQIDVRSAAYPTAKAILDKQFQVMKDALADATDRDE
jgi:hypothetical protein